MKLKSLLFKYLRIIRYLLKGIVIKEAISRASYKTAYQVALGRLTKIDYIPDTLSFHVMHCNLKCPNCLYSLKNGQSFTETDFISVEDFEKLLDLYPFRNISLSGGEPLLHPYFDKLVEACLEKGLTLAGSTNGILVKRWIDSLRHFRRINVSLDSYDYASFEKYRGGNKQAFDLIIEGLKMLREYNINLTMSFMMSAENVHDYRKIVDFTSQYKPHTLVLHSINPHGSAKYTPLLSDNVEVQNFLKDMISRNDYQFSIKLPIVFDVKAPGFKKTACNQMWSRVDVNEKGDVAYCCHLWHDPEIGNIFNGYDFNSPKMIEMRQRHIDGNVPEDCRFCHRRFTDQHYAIFNAHSKRWQIHGYTK